MKFRFLTLGVVLATTSAFQVRAKPLDPALLVGSWKLTAMYDEFADGRKRETWGADPQGILQFTSNGIASVQLTGSARTPQPGTVPTDPAGPLLSYYGTHTVDAASRSFEMHVQRSSWLQWNGAALQRSVQDLSATTLEVVSAPINDPKAGAFQPHLEFERIKQ